MNPPTLFLSLTLVASFAPLAAAWAADIVGPAQVITGNTIAIGGEVVRLADIEAPEPGHPCERQGRGYDCGQEAAWALAERLERHWVTCLPRERDASGHIPAICFLAGPAIDVNGHMVREGWALAVGRRYAEEEAAAQRERRGMWAGKLQWRERRGP